MEKVHREKVISQKLLKVSGSSIEEDKLLCCTLCLPVTFSLAIFSHLSQQFRNQPKIRRCFDDHINIFVMLALFSQETAQNFEKHVLQKCLRITFYTYKPKKPLLFSKKNFKSLCPTAYRKENAAGRAPWLSGCP